MPYFCLNPLATSRALYFSIDPSAFRLILNTHFVPIACCPAGNLQLETHHEAASNPILHELPSASELDPAQQQLLRKLLAQTNRFLRLHYYLLAKRQEEAWCYHIHYSSCFHSNQLEYMVVVLHHGARIHLEHLLLPGGHYDEQEMFCGIPGLHWLGDACAFLFA